jgi:predicted acyltransferase
MSEPTAENASKRLHSLDAYRGLVMLAMASAGLRLPEVVKRLPADAPYRSIWEAAAAQFDHTTWRGCTFWDLIQPSFLFIVGAAMPFSDARRREQGQDWGGRLFHALGRSAILILLAIFLGSHGKAQTDFSFVNVLAQIGLGYTFVFLVLDRPWVQQLGVALAILDGHLGRLRHLSPARSPARPERARHHLGRRDVLGVRRPLEQEHQRRGRLRPLVPESVPPALERTLRVQPGGYATLNFVPSIATMIFGVLAGQWLRERRTGGRRSWASRSPGPPAWRWGVVMDAYLCPVVKRIWTPSWVFFSTGWTCGLLALFYGVIDVRGYRSWAFPLVVVGANSIAIYVMAQCLKPYTAATLKTHLGPHIFDGTYGPMIQSASVLLVFWLICFWMYRNKIFVKI